MWLVALATVLAVAFSTAVILVVLMHVRAFSYARRARAELAAGAAGGAALLRGKLVVGDHQGKVAARTSWSSRRRLWFRQPAPGLSERATELHLDTGDQRVLLDGPTLVVIGSRLRWSGERGMYNDFDVMTALHHGDKVLVLGKRASGALAPLPDGSLRLVAAASPRTSFRKRVLLRHPVMLVALALAMAPAWRLGRDYQRMKATCASECAETGACRIDLRVRQQGIAALRSVLRENVFVCR
ncbi:MAG TPA: hypothetical protein VFB62_06725 [Polyangiaceae bacterium]|jgi:hypothetical protein|nr:hypothetical protein [Polyangiaceae bacterium]